MNQVLDDDPSIKEEYFENHGKDVMKDLCKTYFQLNKFEKEPRLKTYKRSVHLICHKEKYFHVVQICEKKKLSIGVQSCKKVDGVLQMPEQIEDSELMPVVDHSDLADLEVYLNYADFIVDDSSLYFF